MNTTGSELRRTAGSAGVIGTLALLASVIGFFLQLFIAYYFGASKQTDAFFMAQSTSEMLSKLLLGGSITSVFIPLLVERITQRRMNEAWDLALNLLHLTGLAMLVLIVILGIFAQPFVSFIAPGFDLETNMLTVRLLQILLPSFLLVFIVNIFVAMLNSLHNFTLPASLRMVGPLVSLVAVIAFVHSMGIYSLAVGAVVGSLVQVVMVVMAARRQGFRYRFIFAPTHPAIKRLAVLVSPFIASVLVTQVAGIVYRILVSNLAPGSLAALKYGEKVTTLLSVIFLQSVITVLYPLLARKASAKDFNGIRETLGNSIRLLTFMTLPIIVIVMILREPLIALLYQRGSFLAADTVHTSTALLYLIVGLTTNGISALLGYTVLALQETKAAVAVTIISQVVAIILFALLTPVMGIGGLALASSLVPLASALMYVIYLRRHIPDIWQVFYHASFFKIVVLSAFLVGVMIVVTHIPLWNTVQLSDLIARLTIFSGLGVGVYGALAYAWRIPELQAVTGLVRDRVLSLKQRFV